MDEVTKWVAGHAQQGVLWLCEDGAVAFANPAARTLISHALEGSFASLVSDWPALWKGLTRAAASGEIVEFIANGVSVEATVSPTPTGVGMFLRDPTAEQDLHDELMRLASFPEFHPEPVLELDGQLDVTYANELAFDHADAVVERLTTHSDLPQLLSLGGVRRFNIESGERSFTAVVHGLAEWESVRVYLQDVTELERALAAVESTRNELESRVAMRTAALAREVAVREEAERAARAASTAKSAFLANMSHELRTPLNGILGYTELLLDDAQDPVVVKDLERIRRAGRHLLGLISDVLDLAKVEAGRMDVILDSVVLDAVLDEVVDSTRPLARANRSEIRSDFEGLPVVLSDRSRLKQVLLNLVSNACKFTSDGQITVGGRQHETEVELFVQDDGIGIAPDRMEAIFNPFTQEKATTAVEYGGTGLGLALCRELVGLLKGRMAAASVLGEGSRFSVYLPL